MWKFLIISNLYFVNSGCIRNYCIKKDGSEFTTSFTFEGFFNTIPADFLSQKPCSCYIQALEKTELLEINYESFNYLSDRIPDFHYSLLAMSFKNNTEASKEIWRPKAVHKYEWLLNNKPQIIQRISDRLIASYLDISPRTLIRIKPQIKIN